MFRWILWPFSYILAQVHLKIPKIVATKAEIVEWCVTGRLQSVRRIRRLFLVLFLYTLVYKGRVIGSFLQVSLSSITVFSLVAHTVQTSQKCAVLLEKCLYQRRKIRLQYLINVRGDQRKNTFKAIRGRLEIAKKFKKIQDHPTRRNENWVREAIQQRTRKPTLRVKYSTSRLFSTNWANMFGVKIAEKKIHSAQSSTVDWASKPIAMCKMWTALHWFLTEIILKISRSKYALRVCNENVGCRIFRTRQILWFDGSAKFFLPASVH